MRNNDQAKNQDSKERVLTATNDDDATPGAEASDASRGTGRRKQLVRGIVATAVVSAVVAAVIVIGAGVAWAAAGDGGIAEVKQFASRLTNYVTAVAASVAVLFMAVNGIRYTVSNGNPSRQIEAKNGLVSAAVGLAVALSANVLVQLVVSALA